MEKTISSKGQFVLPVDYRKRMGLTDGSRIRIIEDGTRLILEPVHAPQARFVESAGCPRPVLSVGRTIRDKEVIDPLDDDV